MADAEQVEGLALQRGGGGDEPEARQGGVGGLDLVESAISVIEDMLVEMVEESADLVDMLVEGADPAFGERAIIFGLYLAEIMGIQDGSLDRGDQNAQLRSASLRLRHRFAEPMRELAPTSLAMTIEALGGRMKVDAALTLHGSSLLFGQPDLQPFLTAVPPLALRLVTQYLHQSAGEADSSVLEAVARDLFSYVIEGALSGYSAHEVASAQLTNFSDLRPSNVRFDPLGWSSPARDTAIVLLAVLSEFSIERLGDRNLYRSFSEWLNVSHEQSIDVLLPVRIRYSNPHVDPYWRPPDEGLSALMLAPQTSDLLLGWTIFERNFIRYD